MEKKLNNLREKIDELDLKILTLLNKRMDAVKQIGDIKKENKGVFYVPSREHDVYKRLIASNQGLLSKSAVKAIFREIMSASLALEKELKIAYLGPEGTFTHQASMTKFGSSVKYIPVLNIQDVFDEVAKGKSDYGVVPIENSTEGAVTHTLDMFVDSGLKICSEVTLSIKHHMMLKNNSAKNIEKIYSHPQVFAQCRRWILNNYPHADLIDVESTTLAACKAKKEKNSAALASDLAAVIYDLNIIHREIQDSSNNKTRFLIIGTKSGKPTKNDRTSIVFALKDKTGILYDTLKPFKECGINLSKIESRPSKKKAWEYFFFVDLEGHFENINVKKALTKLDESCLFLKILGSYPKEL